MLVYHSLAGSKLRYGLICWATANKSLLNKVTVAQNKIVTYLAFSKRCVRMWPLYCRIKILPLDILISIEYAKTMFKFQRNLLPSAFDTYFQKPSHKYSTRFASGNNFSLIRAESAKETSLLKYIGPKVWLEIPINIRESPSLKVFIIKSYRNFLIGNFDS